MRFTCSLIAVLFTASLLSAQTTQPAPQIHFEPELRDALSGLDRYISPEVRANKRPPNEREKKLARLMTALLLSERPDQAEAGKRNAANIELADKAIREQFVKMRADPANAGQPIQDELGTLEKLSLESIHLLDFLSRPGPFPTTRESQLDLARRLSSIPAMMDREDIVNRDVAHHERRLALLQQMAVQEKAGETEKLTASKDLLAALDNLAVAQAKVDKLNPTTAPTTQP